MEVDHCEQFQLSSIDKIEGKGQAKSFTDALREKYGSGDQDCNFIVDGVVINLVVGRSPSKNGSNAEFAHLRNVVLSQYAIDHAGLPLQGLSSLCPNVVDLDLSSNTLEDWAEVLPLIAQLPSLKFVNLSHNKLKNYNNYVQNWLLPLPTIENLVLNSTNTNWEDVLCLSQHLPALKDLHLCKNGYTHLDCTNLDKLHQVESMWLNDNHLSCWNEIWKLNSLISLKSLFLSGNPVNYVFYNEQSMEKSNSDSPMKTSSFFETPIKSTNFSGDFSQIKSRGKALNARRKLVLSDTLSCDSDLEMLNDIAEQCCSPSKIKCDCDSPFNKTWPQSSPNSSPQRKLSTEMKRQPDSRPIDINYKNSSYRNISRGSSQPENDIEIMDDSSCDSPRFDDSGCGSSLRSNFVSQDDDDDARCAFEFKPFQRLQTLCLSKTKINSWENLYQLRKFPGLHSVRLMDIPFLNDLPPEERRKLYAASLSNISCLNGSEVTLNEREKAERHFLRYYSERPDKPEWYTDLESKHGALKPLVDIDLGARYHTWAKIIFIYNGLEIFTEKVHVVQPVGKLRKHLAKCLALPINGFRMFHYPCSPEHGNIEKAELQELRLDSLPMSRFDLLDGDEIHLDDCSLLSISV